MNYEFVIPDSVHNDLLSLELEFWIVDGIYEEIEKGVTQEQFDGMRRFTFGVTRLHTVDVPDAAIPGVSHIFTLWLNHGPEDNQLTIQQCEYTLWQEWEHDSTAFQDEDENGQNNKDS